MSYSKFREKWFPRPDPRTPVTPEAIEHIEDGVKRAHDAIDDLGDISGNLANLVTKEEANATYGRAQPLRRSALRAAVSRAGMWSIGRESASIYHLYRGLGSGVWLDQSLEVVSAPGGYNNVHQLATTRLVCPMSGVDDHAATYTGSWTHSYEASGQGYENLQFVCNTTSGNATISIVSGVTLTAQHVGRRVMIPGAGAGGADLVTGIGSVNVGAQTCNLVAAPQATLSNVTSSMWAGYRYSTNAGETATWTSPAGATAVGINFPRLANGGLAKVTIDGSTDLANMCPTAQQVVDRGLFPATILVANGGTLNPNDRVVHSVRTENNQWSFWKALAVDLAPLASGHTVVLTSTGYTSLVSGGSNRAYISGFSWAVGGEQLGASGTVLAEGVMLQQGGSAFEYALQLAASSGTTDGFSGSVHGNEDQVRLSIAVNGAAVSMTDGQILPVSGEAVITKVTRLYVAETPATPIAGVTTLYRLGIDGLTVETVIRWLGAASTTASYLMMLPTNGYVFDRFQLDASPDAVALGAGDNSRRGKLRATSCALWSTVHPVAALVDCPQAPAMSGGWSSDENMAVEDRAPAGTGTSRVKFNKVYLRRAGSAAARDVWRGEMTYRWAWLSEPAAKYLPV